MLLVKGFNLPFNYLLCPLVTLDSSFLIQTLVTSFNVAISRILLNCSLDRKNDFKFIFNCERDKMNNE